MAQPSGCVGAFGGAQWTVWSGPAERAAGSAPSVMIGLDRTDAEPLVDAAVRKGQASGNTSPVRTEVDDDRSACGRFALSCKFLHVAFWPTKSCIAARLLDEELS